MINLPIMSYVGAGPIRFGMTAAEVRRVVGTAYSTFKKTAASKMLTDAFHSEGIHVYYKEPGVCEAIEFGKPSRPTFRGTEMLGKPYDEVRAFLTTLDQEVEEDGAGLIAFSLGLGVYAPSAAKDVKLPVEGVSVFEKGYYE